jgi:hypothetical protein
VEENKGNFLGFFKEFKKKRKIVGSEILENKSGTCHILLKPIKDKFHHDMKNLLSSGTHPFFTAPLNPLFLGIPKIFDKSKMVGP